MTHIDDSLAVPTSESLAATVNTDGVDPPLTWLTLNSFLPIFELLGPKFVLDQNAYYIHGLVDDIDLEVLRSYSSMVTEFILTDVDVGKVKPIIAPSTFLCIAQFLEPNSGLLPSLLRLRIIHADIYFPYLHLLHTPSLRTLEANVPDHQHPNFFSFLTNLVHKAPLEEIILGPGQFPLKSLQAILKFTHLQRLELRDATSTIDFTFLQDVGTLLNLESFVLDARSCKYTARIPEKQPSMTPPAERTEAGSRMPQPSSDIDDDGSSQGAYLGSEDTTEVRSKIPELSSDIDSDGPSLIAWPSLSRANSPTFKIYKDKDVDQPLPPIYDQIPCNNDSSISTVGGFYQLKTFHFVGGLSLLQDMVLYIASSALEDISITINHASQDLEAENMRQAAEVEKRKRVLDEEIVAMEKATAIESSYYSQKQKRVVQHLSFNSVVSSKRQAILNKAETQWKEQEAQHQERRKAERLQKYQEQTAILQTVSSRWSAELKRVNFNNLDGTESSQSLSTPPVLPKLVYGTLFCHPKLEILEFKRWELDSVEDFLLSMKSSGPKSLKQLHLPIDDPGSAISLYGLLDIAEACPMLESLQCCIDTLPPIPEYSIPTTKAPFHGLQSLFIANNPTSLWDFNQLLLVARHLHLTFPRIQTIDSVEGPNAEQWVRIRDLVKMIQVTREDYRFS